MEGDPLRRAAHALLQGDLRAPAETLAQAAEWARSQLPTGVTFATHFDEALPARLPVPADFLETMVSNLLVNAADASAEGGRIELSAWRRGKVDFTCTCCTGRVTGSAVLIAVADQGEGMAPEVIARAFVPFFSTRQGSHRRGLGLSVVNGLVHACGGHVSVGAAPGGGTIVTLCLPLADEA